MKLKPVRSATFRGKRFRVLWHIPPRHKTARNDTHGVCEPPDQKGKSICIQIGGGGLDDLDTHIHEALHASLWDLDEFAVAEIATDIARFLWRCGYRPKE